MLTFVSIEARNIFRDNPAEWVTMFRAKIPGGWLLTGHDFSAFTFIPDPLHAWDGTSNP